MKSYSKYKGLKNSFDVCYKGYQMKYIMADDFLFCSYGERKIDIQKSEIKKYLFSTLDFQNFSNQLTVNNAIAFSQSQNRKDYQEYIDIICSNLPNAIQLENVTKLKEVHNYKNILFSFIQIFLLKFLFKKISFKEKFFYFLKLVFYKNSIDSLEKSCKKVCIKSYVPFISAIFKESMYCQFFRKKGMLSYGLQHGIHLNEKYYKDDIPMDIINIENFQADYFLAWGDFMKEIFTSSGIDQGKVLIAGNPKYSDYKAINIQTIKFETGIVCLARNIYEQQNRMLLKILGKIKKENKKEIYIKFHPKNNIQNYQDLILEYGFKVIDINFSILDCVRFIKPDFAIAYNSTVYYEFYINNVFALRFTIDEKDIPFGMDDGFKDYSDLIDLLKTLESRNIDMYNEIINKFINNFFKLNTNNYNKILS